MIQKRRRFLWAKAHLKWTVAKWKTVLWSDESKFEVLFGKLGRHVIRTKEDKDKDLWWYGVAWVHVAWAAYTSGKSPSMLKGISKF